VDPVPDLPLLRKSGSAGNRTRDLWICSQKLWPLHHRGGESRGEITSIMSRTNEGKWIRGEEKECKEDTLRRLVEFLNIQLSFKFLL
jgi:hypothetical protein